jgi:hypothetical protein
VNRDEALKLLKGGEEGIKEWNRRREKGEEIPNLNEANLSAADLSGADLRGAHLREADLSGDELIGTHLSEAELSKANLFGTDLRGAYISGADLSEANLSGADLRGADLSIADLSGADLSGAHISGADLSGANLFLANLFGASLRGANFTKVRCGWTVFADVDLSLAKGLETIVHRGPSTIGVDTLCRSRGNIPEVFLRGCGVPDSLIRSLPSLVCELPIQFYSCFISYSHEDKSFARRLHDTLQGQGIRCWLDEKQLLPGDNIYERVDQGIRLWDKVLLCASKDSLNSEWVDDETTHAFAKEKRLSKEQGKKVLALIPLNLDGYIFEQWEHPKKNQIMERLAADFRGWEADHDKFEREVERVIKALRADESAREKPPEPRL